MTSSPAPAQKADGRHVLRSLPGRPAYPFTESEHELQLEMVRLVVSTVLAPPLPPGYALRQFGPGDEAAYEDLFHLAFADEGRLPETLARVLHGSFFVIEHLASGHLVASCVALGVGNSPRHPGAGQLGWLVTDPSHAGKGLGTIVSALATNRLLAERFTRPFLGTEDFRPAAISIYLRIGWEPFIYAPGMAERWQAILARRGRA